MQRKIYTQDPESKNGYRKYSKPVRDSTGNSSVGYQDGNHYVLQQLIQKWKRAAIHATENVLSSFFTFDPLCTKPLSSSDLKQIPLLSIRLKSIIRSFEKCQESAQKFLNVYPFWERNRRGSISKLNEVAGALDKTRFDCNVAKLTGASVGAAGGILGILGAVLMPFTFGISTPIMIAGAATSVGGAITGLGTTITEVAILKGKVKEAQNVLKVDEMAFQCMEDWFRHSTSYMNDVKELMDFNVFVKILTDAKELFPIFVPDLKVKCEGVSDSDVWKSIILKCINLAVKIAGAPVSSISLIVAILELFEMFLQLTRIHDKNRVLFEGVAATVKFFTLLKGGINVGVNVLSPASAATRAGTMAIPATLPKAVSQGILSGIGLAIEITSIVLTSIDVHKGSKCPTAQNIRNVKEQLQTELDILEDVHKIFKK